MILRKSGSGLLLVDRLKDVLEATVVRLRKKRRRKRRKENMFVIRKKRKKGKKGKIPLRMVFLVLR